jgi:3-methyladenine DNA glycosylase AlkD
MGNWAMTKDVTANVRTLANRIVADLRKLPVLKVEGIRKVRRAYSKELADSPPKVLIDLGLELIGRPHLVYRIVAYELIHHHRPALRSLKGKSLERLGQGIDHWAAVDTFAGYLSGPAWCNGQVSDKLIHRWAHAKDRWWRRAALVSTVPLNLKSRGGCGDAVRTLGVCRLLVDDRDDLVVKAMSWALRALAVRDAKSVKAFLTEHGDALAARVRREVRNKLTTGLKNPRK